MNLELKPGANTKNNGIVVELVQIIKNFNLSIHQSNLEKYVHIDNKVNEKYVAAVLENVKELLDLMNINETGVDEDNDVNLPK